MPRRKLLQEANVSLSKLDEDAEQQPEIAKRLRSTRRRRQTDVEKQSVDEKTVKKKSGPKSKKAKIIDEKIQADDENSTISFEQNSPNSTDSGIGSGSIIKNSISSRDTSDEKDSVIYKTGVLESKTSNSSNQKRIRKVKTDHAEKPKSTTKLRKQPKEKMSKQKIKEPKTKPRLEKENCLADLRATNSSISENGSCSTNDETALEVLTRLEFDNSVSQQISKGSKFKDTFSENGSSSDSDWEEVEEHKEQNLEDYNPVIPKDGVEITIDCPELKHKRKKKQFDHMEYVRLYINRERKEHQLCVHKTHLLCLIAHGFYINDLLNRPLLKAYVMSIVPPEICSLTTKDKINKIDLKEIKTIVDWFCNFFTFENSKIPFVEINKHLPEYFQNQNSLCASEYNLIFLVIVRVLGFKARFCKSLYPISYKAKNLLKKPGSKSSTDKKSTTSSEAGNSSQVIHKKERQLKSVSAKKESANKSSKNKKKKLDIEESKETHRRRSKKVNYKMSSGESDSNDDDFVPEKSAPKEKPSKKESRKQSSRSILSSDSAPSSPETSSIPFDKIVCWSEVFCKKSKQWIPIECSKHIVNEPYEIEKLLPQPVTYIITFDNESYVKDVTRRYCSEYMTSTVKMRVDPEWWEETLDPFLPPNSKLDKEEEKKLEETLINKPLPTTVSGFKNHPLYALKRHLLKFEGIYPPDAAPVGFLRKEPVYARECVCQLHSRETWVKEARVVRAGEQPYKIVKARPKWDRIAGVMRTDLPLEIFGFWQTDPYKPPVAIDGKVPRNEYGNVELFKPCMLPVGTVHLQYPGLNRVAKKLGIDCSPAVIGFDGHKGSIHPVFDGFVVCKEYEETLLAAWEEEQENARRREEEKREKRIYGNWKKLIRGLLIRERIKLKYDVK